MDKLTSGPGSIILPLAVAGASMAMPRVGQGLSAGLGVLDWARRNRKTQEEDRAFSDLAGALTGGGASAAPTPPTTATLGAGTSEGQQVNTPGMQQFPGVTKEMLGQPGVARLLIPYLLNNYEKQNTAREHFGVAGNQPGVYQSPGLGKPYVFQPVGPTNLPNFPTGIEPVAKELFNKPTDQLTQQEMGQVNQTIAQRAQDTKELENKRIQQRQEASQGRLFDKQLGAADAARTKEDRTKAQQEFTGMNRWWDKGFSSIDTEYNKQVAGLPAPGSEIGKKKIAELDAWKTQQRQGLVGEYQAGFEDMKGRYSHIDEGLPWSKGTPGLVDMRIKKFGGGGATQPTAADVQGYRKALEANRGNQQVIDAINKKAMGAWGKLP